MRYAIYARISPRGSGFDDPETSIPMQIQFCRDYIKLHGGEVAGVWQDEFLSGKNTARPQFRDMMARMDAWDAVICYKLSRFSRNRRDCENLFYEITEAGKSFVSATEQIDLSTVSGRAYVGMLSIFNQMEREQTAENTRNRMLSIAASGGWPSGNPPYGYRRSGVRHDNVLQVDPVRGPMLQRAFQMAADGASLPDICRFLDRTKQVTIDILRNRTYLGKIVYAGKEFHGKHPALVSDDLFRQANDGRGAVNVNGVITHPAAQKFPYYLAGILRCSCGRCMTPASAKSGKYHYYQCTDGLNCKHRVNADALQEAVWEVLGKIHYSEQFLRGVRDGINAERQKMGENVRPQLDAVRKSLADARAEQKRLTGLFLSGVVTMDNKDHFNRELAEINLRVSNYEEQEQALRNTITAAGTDVAEELNQLVLGMTNMQRHLAEVREDPALLRKFSTTYIQKISRVDDTTWEITMNLTELKKFVYLKEWLPAKEKKERLNVTYHGGIWNFLVAA